MRLPLIVRVAVSVVVVACGMLSAVRGQISETSAPRPTTLRTLTDLPKFHSYQDLREFSIDFEATVTYWDSDRRKLFVQDKNQAIYVQVTRIPDRLDFEFGDRVSVIGSMNIAEGFVDGTSVRVIDKGPISVTPMTVDLSALHKGANWSRLIVTKGELRRVVRTGLKTQLLLVAGTRKLECFVHDSDHESEFSSLIGSELSVTGVLDWETYDTGVPRMALCQVMSPSSVKIVSRSKAPESPTANQFAPLNIESLKELTLAEEGAKVRAAGVVSFVDRGERFLLEDETGSALVKYEGLELVFVGANLSIDATVGPEHRLILERAEMQEVLRRVSPILKTTARKIIGDPINYRRVSVVGTVDIWSSDGREREVLLTSEGFQYRVVFTADDEAFENIELARGSRMGCQGMVVQEADAENAWFTVHVASLDTLVTDRGTFHIEKSKAAAWLFGVAVMGLLIAAWILTMRMQVARKTKHLSGLTARLNASYGAVKEGVVVLDESHRVVSVNNQFRNVTGIKLNVGDHADRIRSELRRLFECDDLPRLLDAMTNPQSSPVEMEMQAIGDNQSRIVAYLSPVEDETVREIGKLLAIEDVTKQKQLEDTLVQSQKMEAVARLAGGVSHDFNNLLMAMSCNVDLAQMEIGDNSPRASSRLSETKIAVDRAAELVKSLLGFSRRSELQLSIGSLNDSVANVSGLIYR
ncbi:MAG: PAS domain-containing protein, partial [Rubripirellula sp.]